MPRLTVQGMGEFEVSAGKRLVNALTDDAKVDQLHACGGGRVPQHYRSGGLCLRAASRSVIHRARLERGNRDPPGVCLRAGHEAPQAAGVSSHGGVAQRRVARVSKPPLLPPPARSSGEQ